MLEEPPLTVSACDAELLARAATVFIVADLALPRLTVPLYKPNHKTCNYSPATLRTSPDFSRVFNRCPACTSAAERMTRPVSAFIVIE